MTEERLQWYEANGRSQGLQGGAVQALTELCAEVRRLKREVLTLQLALRDRLKAEQEALENYIEDAVTLMGQP